MKIGEPYVIGLDWAGKNSWAYCRLPIEADVLGADDVLDAAAMALVALGWARLGPRLRVIRSEDGRPTELGEAPGADQVRLMALPEAAGRSTG